MQDLRLIGVHEDGQHLLLADADGGRYRLTLDEALRAAARRDRPRLGQLQIEIEGGLRPRDVQALIRRGLSTEEVADRAGWTVEKVRRFEGPVLAEREHVAQIAQQCAVGSRGHGPVTLAERVAERLRDRGVERDDVEWDSARDDEGVWSADDDLPRRRPPAHRDLALRAPRRVGDRDQRRGPLAQRGGRGRRDPHAPPRPHVGRPRRLRHRRRRRRRARRPGACPARADRPHGRDARAQRPWPPSRRRPSPSQTPGEDLPRADALPLEDLALDPADVSPPPASRGRNPVQAHLEEPTTSDEEVGGWPEESAVPGRARGPRRRRGPRARDREADAACHRRPRRPTGPAARAPTAPTAPRTTPRAPERRRRPRGGIPPAVLGPQGPSRACPAGTTSSSAPAAAAPPDLDSRRE